MNKSTRKYLLAGIFLIAVFIIPFSVFAQTNELAQVGQAAGLPQSDLTTIIGNIIKVVLASLGIIAVVLIIYAGFIWMTAGGNPEKVIKAKKILIGGVIGLLLIVSSYAIASFIINRLIEATGGNTTTSTGQTGVGGLSGLPRCVCPKGDAPYICSVSPASAPIGGYVTIWGCRFGNYDQSKSKVKFGDKDSSIAMCGDKPAWKDTKIVAVVPAGLTEDTFYNVIVSNNSESVNSKRFKVTTGAPGPGIACVVPDLGKQGEAVEIFGDRFGEAHGGSKVSFGKIDVIQINSWEGKKINLNVPYKAITSEVKAVIGGAESNGYLFTVKCDLADDCRGGTYCCDGLCDMMVCANTDGSCAGDRKCPADYSCCPDKVCRKNCNVDGSCAEGASCPQGYNCCEDKICRINCEKDVVLCNNNGVQDNGETGIDCGGGSCPLCGSLGTTCYSSPGVCGTDDLCQFSTGQCKGEESECRCCCRDNAGCSEGLTCDMTKACGGKVKGLCCGCQSASQCKGNETCSAGCCQTCQGVKDGGECKGGICCGGECCHGDCQNGVCVPACGNGKIDPGEECDGEDLGGKGCESLGYSSGTLICSYRCTLDAGQCLGAESGSLGDVCVNAENGCTSGKADCKAGGSSTACVQNNPSAPCACCCRVKEGINPDSCGTSNIPGCNMFCDATKPCGQSGQKGICCGCTKDDCCNNGLGQICLNNCCYPFPSPTNLVITGANVNQIGLKWKDNSDYETGFEIYRSLDNKTWQLIGGVDKDVTVYIDSEDANGAEPGNFNKDQKYYYKVRAKR